MNRNLQYTFRGRPATPAIYIPIQPYAHMSIIRKKGFSNIFLENINRRPGNKGSSIDPQRLTDVNPK
jgi:hypothetical protein